MALSFVFCCVTMYGQRNAGAFMTDTQLPIRHRVANALLSYVHYLVQMVVPGHYSVFYPYPTGFSSAAVALAVLLLLSLSFLAWRTRRKRPYIAFGWIWYVVTLLPVIGLIQVGSQSHADRYTYVPLIGIFIVVAWVAHDLSRRWGDAEEGSRRRFRLAGTISSEEKSEHPTPKMPNGSNGPLSPTLSPSEGEREKKANLSGFSNPPRWRGDSQALVLSIAASVATILCIGLTRQQIGYWKDSETLARHALAVTPDNPVAHNVLGVALAKRGRVDEAIAHFEEATRLASRYAMAQGNLGAALFTKGRLDESIQHSREAIRLQPDFAGAYGNLGAALGAKGRVDEAIAALQQAMKLDPSDAQAHYNLGFALAGKGRMDEAIAQYRELVRLQPGNPTAQKILNAALAAKAAAQH